MRRPRRSEIWLVRFPFTDLTSTKLRPALVWAVHAEDVILLGVFSHVGTGTAHETWVLLEERHPSFPQLGLKKTSVLKAEKIAVVHETVFNRRLGNAPPGIMRQVEAALKKALLLA